MELNLVWKYNYVKMFSPLISNFNRNNLEQLGRLGTISIQGFTLTPQAITSDSLVLRIFRW